MIHFEKDFSNISTPSIDDIIADAKVRSKTTEGNLPKNNSDGDKKELELEK